MTQTFPDAPPLAPADADVLTRAAAVADRCAAFGAYNDDPRHGPRIGADFPATEFGWLRDAGLLADPLPRALGGSDLNAPGQWWTLLQVLKHVGRGCLPAGRIYEGHVNALALITRLGTLEQQARAADDVLTYGRIFGVWNADDEGPHAAPLRLADLGGGRYRMEGKKIFCSGAGHLTRPLAGARWHGENGGWQLCLVPMDTLADRVDDTWWQPMGMASTASASVDFTGLEFGPETLLGGPNTYYEEPGFNGGAIRFAAVHLGGAEALYDAARAYLRRAGKADSAVQRVRFADLAMRIESGALWLRGAAASAERPPADAREIVAYAAMTRAAIEAVCMDVITGVERAVGARGLMRPFPFPRLVRDLSMYIRQPAADIITERIGRNALDDPRPAHAMWPQPGDCPADATSVLRATLPGAFSFMARLTQVEALPGHRLRLSYSDGVKGEIDLSGDVGRGVFAPLADEMAFGKVHIGEYGQIAWSDDLDICPDSAYLKILRKPADSIHA